MSDQTTNSEQQVVNGKQIYDQIVMLEKECKMAKLAYQKFAGEFGYDYEVTKSMKELWEKKNKELGSLWAKEYTTEPKLQTNIKEAINELKRRKRRLDKHVVESPATATIHGFIQARAYEYARIAEYLQRVLEGASLVDGEASELETIKNSCDKLFEEMAVYTRKTKEMFNYGKAF